MELDNLFESILREESNDAYTFEGPRKNKDGSDKVWVKLLKALKDMGGHGKSDDVYEKVYGHKRTGRESNGMFAGLRLRGLIDYNPKTREIELTDAGYDKISSDDGTGIGVGGRGFEGAIGVGHAVKDGVGIGHGVGGSIGVGTSESSSGYRKFDEIRIGDIGKDYFGEKCVILHKCKASEASYLARAHDLKVDTYGIEEGISEGDIMKDSPCVFVTMIEGPATSARIAYVYGSDGVTVGN